MPQSGLIVTMASGSFVGKCQWRNSHKQNQWLEETEKTSLFRDDCHCSNHWPVGCARSKARLKFWSEKGLSLCCKSLAVCFLNDSFSPFKRVLLGPSDCVFIIQNGGVCHASFSHVSEIPWSHMPSMPTGTLSDHHTCQWLLTVTVE